MKKKSHILFVLPMLLLLTACSVGTETGMEKAATGTESEANTAAIRLYHEFLASDQLYSITATPEYPRGDSCAVYAFGDSNGDGVPELHLDGAAGYFIYTVRDGEVTQLCEYEPWSFQWMVPLRTGAIVSYSYTEQRDSYNATRKIPVTGEAPEGESGQYSCIMLNYDGVQMDSVWKYGGKDRPEWIRKLLSDPSLRLSWQPVFPEDTWAYLDAMEYGNGDDRSGECPEWKIYEQLLSGDFSQIEALDERSRMVGRYRSSLSEESGRSGRKYILKDFNSDGVLDLFVRLYPQESDYSTIDIRDSGDGFICFSYIGGELTWWELDVSHEAFVPLSDGRVLYLSSYGVSAVTMVGRLDAEFQYRPDTVYEGLTVEYDDYHDREWYETSVFGQKNWELYTFCERIYEYPQSMSEEGVYHFIQDCENKKTGPLTPLPQEAWRTVRSGLEKLLIKDDQWKPVSVFLPVRNQEEFSQG